MNNNTDTTGYVSHFLHQVASDIPRFLGVLAILIIGYIVAKVIAAAIRTSLRKARLNEHLHAGKGGNIIQRAIPDPSNLIAKTAFWLLFLFAVSVAVSELGIPALVQIVHGIYAYIPNVIAALLIFLVAGVVSGAASTLVANTMGDTPTGKIAAMAAPIVVMGVATFMILNQLQIAPAIVTITYAGLVATATLAFGLGGREAASRMFMNLYEAGQANKAAVAADIRKGAANARSRAQDLKNRAQDQL